jgi:cytochrome c oxidase cbb3-type subunit III
MERSSTLALLLLSLVGMLWSSISEVHAGNPEHGREIYDQWCWRCHGRLGKSDGPVSDAMAPRPRDLTGRAHMETVTDGDLLKIIKHGGAAVGKSPAMMAFEEALSDDDIRDLVAFIRLLCCQ